MIHMWATPVQLVAVGTLLVIVAPAVYEVGCLINDAVRMVRKCFR
jgi:hypothetical protein